MSRSADYTIQGFLYQFNKTLIEILKAPDDAEIHIEGIIEDIEIKTPNTLEAIQCKYHETQDKFALSTIYKPLLQMMHHYHLNNDHSIKYKLFCHFPSDSNQIAVTITKAELVETLKTQNKVFQKYTTVLNIITNLDQFLENFLKQFSIEIGDSLENLTKEIHVQLCANGIPADDIDILAYPNAIQHVADLSIKHDAAERKTTKKETIQILKEIKKTAISRWTLSLKTRREILKERRNQLKSNLDKNTRLRYLIVDPEQIDNFDTEFVVFIQEFQEKYHFKQAHTCTPILCLTLAKDDVKQIQLRLELKGITCNDGMIAGIQFDESRFFKDPIVKKTKGADFQREFALRIIAWQDAIPTINNKKADDIFIISSSIPSGLDTRDINIELLSTSSLAEIKYIMGISNVFE